MKLKNQIKSIGLNKIKPNNLMNSLRVYTNKALSVRWCPSKNWGDAVNPFLIEKIIKKPVYHSSTIINITNSPIIYGIGSIISLYEDEKKVIWGSGLISENEKINNIDQVLAVRGLLSAKKLGYTGKNFGDPAILTSKFFKPNISTKKFKVGIIPHYSEFQELKKSLKNPEFLIIDITSSIQKVIDDVNSCESILSSSLHGLVLSDSFQIPNKQIKISNNLIGGQFKFLDYYSGINCDYSEPIQISDYSELKKAAGKVENNYIGISDFEYLEKSLKDYLQNA